MTKKIKSNTQEHLSLILELYCRIPQGRKTTAQLLQKELALAGIERDIRTIQRNLELISNYFDVDKDTRDKPYGYSRKLHQKMVLGLRESIILGLAEVYLRAALPNELSSVIDSAFIQIKNSSISTLPPLLSTRKVHADIDISSHLQSVQLYSIFERICLALTCQRLITIKKHNHSIHKNVEPLGLILTNTELYLIYRTEAIKHMPISHIHTIDVSTFLFDYPDGFNLESYNLLFSNKLIIGKPSIKT
ncbi:hypothetical protein ERW49_18115 [Aliivibrio finisterrensis]|uniref:WYL domain-containing protein n=1 Tax=Aliivibrio finisterrensis TaxID=511998 RepID=A0A4Q5K8I0_9GAMM|nr:MULTISPECIES: hypothetical protein [Aliivibrio]MDD9173772.1 hypothetical protein [Aliivibrio sp. S3TY1]MDD9190848.1 hypothetical protein [Aliivibrio sp. S2TY2]RYU42156.1 hypothetical protein ERW49_18115 [Aliivibrio finisterrensis]